MHEREASKIVFRRKENLSDLSEINEKLKNKANGSNIFQNAIQKQFIQEPDVTLKYNKVSTL